MPSKLGLAIRHARESQGMSLRALARHIQKSPTYVVALELADDPPGVAESTLGAIAAVLGLDPDDLFALAAKTPADARPRSASEMQLYRLIRDLPTDEQQRLIDTLRRRRTAGKSRRR